LKHTPHFFSDLYNNRNGLKGQGWPSYGHVAHQALTTSGLPFV
jgi:hypothetical protein